MNYTKSFLSIMICASLISAITMARPIEKKEQSNATQNVQPSRWFILGQKHGKEILKCAPQNPEYKNYLLRIEECFQEVASSIYTETLGTADYTKKLFEALKEVHRGFKEGISSFKPLKGNDHASRRMNSIIKLIRLLADCFIESKDFDEYEEKEKTKIVELQDEALTVLPLDRLGQYAGLTKGLNLCYGIRVTEGKEVSPEVTDRHKKQDEKFFAFIDTYTAEEKKEILRHYYSSMVETLENASIDAFLEATPKERANTLKRKYYADLKEAQENLASVNSI